MELLNFFNTKISKRTIIFYLNIMRNYITSYIYVTAKYMSVDNLEPTSIDLYSFYQRRNLMIFRNE